VKSEQPIFTYRDERRLFAIISVIIVTALVALIQISALRAGSPSLVTNAGTTLAFAAEEALSSAVTAVRSTALAVAAVPGLARDNAALKESNLALEQQNARLHELVAAYRQESLIQPRLEEYPRAVEARVIGFPPENAVQSVTIDRGTHSGIARDDGVLAGAGVVGRVVEAGPFSSKVALVTDFTSTIPAVVRRGRFWGIAKGNQNSIRLDYVSQDAPLKVGDRVVTGEARSFHSGDMIGTIASIQRSDASLYETAVLKPAVNFSTLDRVVVLTK
jgi:rod shape-determining protein MreC